MLEKLLSSSMPITKQIAAIVNLNTYATDRTEEIIRDGRTGPDGDPLQRVVNLMAEGVMLARPFNVSPRSVPVTWIPGPPARGDLLPARNSLDALQALIPSWKSAC